jgi:hypothetical protein
MRKIKFTLIILIGIFACANAQDLYVAPSSYVFVQDEVIFVNDDIQLEATDSNIYLRGDAQLLQNSDTKNSDIGELSVYQQQTTGIYEYNYWSSPVGVGVDNTTKANANFAISNLHQPDAPNVNSNVSSITYGTIGGYNSTASQIAYYWLWKLEAADGYNGWSPVSNYSSAEAGLGFTMKGSPTSNNTIDFRGRPNTGTITRSCLYNSGNDNPNYGIDGQVYTLTGNPYPSAIDLLLFLNNPTNTSSLDGSVYFWEQKNVGSHYLSDYEGGYAVWTPITGNPTDPGLYAVATFGNYDIFGESNSPTSGTSDDYTGPFTRRFAAIGQGFLVKSDISTTGGNFQFDNSMRVYMPEAVSKTTAGSQFGRESNQSQNTSSRVMSHNGMNYLNILENPEVIPQIKIHTRINDTYYRENVLAFNHSKDNNYNKYGDALSASLLKSDTYFIADNYELVIKSIAYDIDAKIPFGFNAKNQTNTYSVTINSMKDVSEDIEVFVYDKELETYNDIKNGTFDISLPEGEYNDRFEIVFRDTSREILGEILDNEAEVTGSFDVYQNNTSNQFIIKNPQSHIVKSFIMYDVTGKMIFNKQNLGNELEYSFPTNNLSSGTYITKITTNQNFEITKKVIVNN